MKNCFSRRSVIVRYLLGLSVGGWFGGAAAVAQGKPPPGPPGHTSYPLQDLVRHANPMCGTDGKAFTFPGAVAPFGMIQWSPDTEGGARKGGYSVQDSRISGFSLDHISGAGCAYGEDFQIMPLPGG